MTPNVREIRAERVPVKQLVRSPERMAWLAHSLLGAIKKWGYEDWKLEVDVWLKDYEALNAPVPPAYSDSPAPIAGEDEFVGRITQEFFGSSTSCGIDRAEAEKGFREAYRAGVASVQPNVHKPITEAEFQEAMQRPSPPATLSEEDYRKERERLIGECWAGGCRWREPWDDNSWQDGSGIHNHCLCAPTHRAIAALDARYIDSRRAKPEEPTKMRPVVRNIDTDPECERLREALGMRKPEQVYIGLPNHCDGKRIGADKPAAQAANGDEDEARRIVRRSAWPNDPKITCMVMDGIARGRALEREAMRGRVEKTISSILKSRGIQQSTTGTFSENMLRDFFAELLKEGP